MPEGNTALVISHQSSMTWGIEEKDNARLIEKLTKDNFINEERYAAGYVRDKFNYNKWGKIKIALSAESKRHSRGDNIKGTEFH